MIERHITFTLADDRDAEFERFFAEQYGPAVVAAPGNLRIDLIREMDQPTRYRMVFRWTDQASAVAWRTSPVHTALQPALNALVTTGEIVAYQVIA